MIYQFSIIHSWLHSCSWKRLQKYALFTWQLDNSQTLGAITFGIKERGQGPKRRNSARLTFCDVKMFSQKVSLVTKSHFYVLIMLCLRLTVNYISSNIKNHLDVLRMFFLSEMYITLKAIKWCFMGMVGSPLPEKVNT